MQSLRKSVSILLLAVIVSLSLASCGKKYITPDYALPTPEEVRAKQPNCYDAIQYLKTVETVTADQCLDIVDCSEENAIYWEYLYFDLRDRITGASDL